jgi:hypothetical protein
MSEDTFKPERTPIDPSELGAPEPAPEAVPEAPVESGEAVTQKLQEMEAMRSNAAAEGQGIQMTGTPPPQFQQVMAQVKSQNQPAPELAAPGESRRMQTRKSPKHRAPQNAADMRVTGSERLEELIKGIEEQAIYEPIELPSKGAFYDGSDGPQDGVLHIRPMTGEEEQILATPRFVRKGQAINMIFNRCIQEKYDTEQFLTQDRTYLLIYLRGISYTPEYDVEVRDPETDQTFATTIDLNALYVDYCPADFNETNLTDVLPTTGYQFTYRLARGGDEQDVQNYRDHRAKNFDLSSQADDTLLYRTSLLIDNIEGLTSRTEIQMLMRKLPISDVAYMRDATSNPPFGVNTTVTIQSPYTLQDFEIELPLEANFFFPRAKKGTKGTR